MSYHMKYLAVKCYHWAKNGRVLTDGCGGRRREFALKAGQMIEMYVFGSIGCKSKEVVLYHYTLIG